MKNPESPCRESTDITTRIKDWEAYMENLGQTPSIPHDGRSGLRSSSSGSDTSIAEILNTPYEPFVKANFFQMMCNQLKSLFSK